MIEVVTGIFNQSYQQIFLNARIMRVSAHEDATVMEHPVESGAITTDHRIINLIKLDLSIIIEPANVKNIYTEIKQNYTNGTLLTVQTLTTSYKSQFITGLPHEEDSKLFRAIVLNLSLCEFRTTQTNQQPIIVPINPNDTPTVNRGTQLPLSVTQIQTLEAKINAPANPFSSSP